MRGWGGTEGYTCMRGCPFWIGEKGVWRVRCECRAESGDRILCGCNGSVRC